MDIPAMGRCVPGVESVEPIEGDRYEGTLKTRVGPIAVKIVGTIELTERDRDQWHAQMDAHGSDKMVGGVVNAKMAMQLVPLEDGQTEMEVRTDASILGKLGQFGQGVIKKKADQVMAEFAQNVTRALSEQ